MLVQYKQTQNAYTQWRKSLLWRGPGIDIGIAIVVHVIQTVDVLQVEIDGLRRVSRRASCGRMSLFEKDVVL